jgi:hypothetical protein
MSSHERFQICEEIIIAGESHLLYEWANLTKEIYDNWNYFG